MLITLTPGVNLINILLNHSTAMSAGFPKRIPIVFYNVALRTNKDLCYTSDYRHNELWPWNMFLCYKTLKLTLLWRNDRIIWSLFNINWFPRGISP